MLLLSFAEPVFKCNFQLSRLACSSSSCSAWCNFLLQMHKSTSCASPVATSWALRMMQYEISCCFRPLKKLSINKISGRCVVMSGRQCQKLRVLVVLVNSCCIKALSSFRFGDKRCSCSSAFWKASSKLRLLRAMSAIIIK